MMNKAISEIKTGIETLSERVDELCDEKEALDLLKNAADELEESWSQSWIGFHANLYYKDFSASPSWENRFNSEWGSIAGIPDYWMEKTYSDVQNYIQEKHKDISIEKIEAQVSDVLKIANDIQDLITTELVFLEDKSAYAGEWELVKELESHSWGVSQQNIIEYLQPKEIMTRDSFALQQGIKTPPHIMFEAYAIHVLSEISSLEDFIRKAKKIVRQLEVKTQLVSEPEDTQGAIETVMGICVRFHHVARQLRDRHQNRETLKIDDEYDAQDLFQALLKLSFDDVRKEEWNPSYAGGSSRSDFLIKKEKIVVELKKTRKGLADRELGEQLIIDIIKYKQHPDCKTLICFVYDPEGIIGNPAGIEEDLSKLSSDEMIVITRIEPK